MSDTTQAQATVLASASVKVMRSYDYCHFEVNLGVSGPVALEEVDALRKAAARLADKAVAQYKIAKRACAKRESDEQQRYYQRQRIAHLAQTPVGELTPSQLAELKEARDRAHEASVERRAYDYEDDWRNEDEDEQEF